MCTCMVSWWWYHVGVCTRLHSDHGPLRPKGNFPQWQRLPKEHLSSTDITGDDLVNCKEGFLDGSDSKESACNADLGSKSGLESSSGEGNGDPLQYSCLETPMDRGAWRATVHGIAESDMMANWVVSILLSIDILWES